MTDRKVLEIEITDEQVFALFVSPDQNESERDELYQVLVDRGIRMEDVARNVGGNRWATNYRDIPFTVDPVE